MKKSAAEKAVEHLERDIQALREQILIKEHAIAAIRMHQPALKPRLAKSEKSA